MEELYIQLFLLIHSWIGQTLTWGLISRLSLSDNWLLIYGREKAKVVVASKTVLVPGDKKSDPMRSVIEKQLRGRLRYFKCSSVAKVR